MAAFEGLRALAAGLVPAYHVGIATDVSRIWFLGPVAWGMKSGVTLFFVISGFLLYRPYPRAIGHGEPLPGWRA